MCSSRFRPVSAAAGPPPSGDSHAQVRRNHVVTAHYADVFQACAGSSMPAAGPGRDHVQVRLSLTDHCSQCRCVVRPARAAARPPPPLAMTTRTATACSKSQSRPALSPGYFLCPLTPPATVLARSAQSSEALPCSQGFKIPMFVTQLKQRRPSKCGAFCWNSFGASLPCV